MTDVMTPIVYLDFGAEYVQDADSALNRLALLLADESQCKLRISWLRQAKAQAGRLNRREVTSTTSTLPPRDDSALLQTLLDGTLAESLVLKTTTAEAIDSLTLDPEALWNAHERFISFDDSEALERESELTFEAAAPFSSAATSPSPSTPNANTATALVSRGDWSAFERMMPPYLRAILSLIDQPEEWAGDWLTWIEPRAKAIDWSKGERFRDHLRGWAFEFLRSNGVSMPESGLSEWNWEPIVSLGALISRLEKVPPAEYGAKYVKYIRSQARSCQELSSLPPSADFSAAERRLFPFFREEFVPEVSLAEHEARRFLELAVS